MTFTANMGALTIIYTYIFRPNSVLQDRELGDQLSANIVVLLTGWKCSVGKKLQNIEICEHVDTYVATHGVIYLEGNCSNDLDANCTCDVS